MIRGKETSAKWVQLQSVQLSEHFKGGWVGKVNGGSVEQSPPATHIHVQEGQSEYYETICIH